MSALFFQEEGSGQHILLIHGFPFTSDIWSQFTPHLSKNFHVITIDLPGFGKSPLPKSSSFTLDDIANQIRLFLDEQKLKDIVVIGHSLGGYVTLAMVEQRPELFAGFGLFHSTAYADSPEKKVSRTKVIEFVKRNGVEAFTSNFISPLFADPNHPKIPEIRAMNLQATEKTVRGYTEAMRDRPDRTDVIKNFPRPILFISGEKDQGIQPPTIREQALLAKRPFVFVLPDQVHMSLIEDIETTGPIVENFVRGC